jgi:hypothetical protein
LLKALDCHVVLMPLIIDLVCVQVGGYRAQRWNVSYQGLTGVVLDGHVVLVLHVVDFVCG